jgi:hypothetical protein
LFPNVATTGIEAAVREAIASAKAWTPHTKQIVWRTQMN